MDWLWVEGPGLELKDSHSESPLLVTELFGRRVRGRVVLGGSYGDVGEQQSERQTQQTIHPKVPLQLAPHSDGSDSN